MRRQLTFIADNSITLLHSGAEYFPTLIAVCDAAKIEICLETYIFGDDDTASQVKAALVRAAQRGVLVKLIVDWLGTGTRYCAQLQQEMQPACTARFSMPGSSVVCHARIARCAWLIGRSPLSAA